MKQYFWNIFLLLDCAIDSILFGSSPFELMSSRAWRHRDCWQGAAAVKLVDWLALHIFGQPNHCKNSEQMGCFYAGYEVIK